MFYSAEFIIREHAVVHRGSNYVKKNLIVMIIFIYLFINFLSKNV